MQKKTSKQTPKTNRGRPQKVFQSRKPLIKRNGPGRPTKQEALAIKQHIQNTIRHKTIDKPIPGEKNIRDLIIFVIFLISGGIFIFSLYIARNKNTNPILPTNNISPEEVSIQTGITQTGMTET